ncbi:MAG: hypothetical protein HDS42_02715 [Bacteroides sp.]|nr:hypothetical protein [Bacteroides sp.]
MKKIFILLSFFCGLSFYSQAQFATYQPLDEVNQARANQAQTIYGYVSTSKGWVRVSLRVVETKNSICVVGYKPNTNSSNSFATYGNPNNWISCQSWAENVSAYRDGQVAANNFDYRASVSGLGTVYF